MDEGLLLLGRATHLRCVVSGAVEHGEGRHIPFQGREKQASKKGTL